MQPLTGHALHRLKSIRKQHPAFPFLRFQSISKVSIAECSVPSKNLEEPLNRKRMSLTTLLQRYGFASPSQLRNLLDRNKLLLDWSSGDIGKSLDILSSLKLPQKVLVSMVCNCPGVLEYNFMRKWKVGLSKMRILKAPPSAIKSVLECALRYQVNPDDFFKTIRILNAFGLSDCTVARILEEFPVVMVIKEAELQQRLVNLISIGIPKNEIDRICSLFPEIVRFMEKDSLKPLLHEFLELGFSDDSIRNEIVREPKILGMEVGELTRCLELLRTSKCREPIKNRVFSMGTFRAGFEVKLRVDCLCRHGLIRREAFKVLWKEPRVVLYAIDDIEKKIEFLVHGMNFDVDWLVEVPEYLGVNLQKHIVPRYNVIEYLRSKGGLGCEVGLKAIAKLSRRRFYNYYVKPYPECEKMYPLLKDVELKNEHPIGLWKIMKPPKYPESEEDVKNMKSFVGSLV